MPRPFARRRICAEPEVTYYKPAGVPLREMEEVSLGFDEFEALRLVDFLAMGQEDAGEKMGISQPTLSRVISSARKKIAEALTQGKALRIEGGNYELKR
ncbi:MAG: DUF134 domain-containing protein [Candidatus ainarchaeum sp.]|nr:DUF134 domain-containing protein [Candidatus ainarchaeum sp.]